MNALNYIKVIVLHVFIGILVYSFPIFSKVYLLSLFVYFLIRIFKAGAHKRSLEILIACGYVVGAEVFLRMTRGSFLYETSKYMVILFCLIGFFTINLNRKSTAYFMYILLLVPGIFVAGFNVTEHTTIRTAIAFNLSGPICLGIVAIFCYKLKIRYVDIHKIILAIGLPLIATTTYLFLYTPDIRAVVMGTYSNYATSGGFGPNQVATVLGFGMFVFTTRFFLKSPTFTFKVINLMLLGAIAYRGIVTFSRGGIITGVIIIVAFLYSYYIKSTIANKKRIVKLVSVFASVSVFVWLLISIQTNGFIDNRYTNKDALGREKEDLSTGRNQLISFEFQAFYDNPLLGVGVGKIKELREQEEGIQAASHNEMSRIVSEHGLFGLFAFLTLLMMPLLLRLKNRSNIFFFSCFAFWFLTINHSSMRIAAPSFIYGLCLLHFIYEPTVNTKGKVNKKIA